MTRARLPGTLIRFALAAVALLAFATPSALRAQAPASEAGQATGRVVGRVTDSRTLQPIRDILVQVPGTRGTVLTDGDGRFVLPGVPAGSVTLRLSWFGYRDQEVAVEVVAGRTVRADAVMEAEPLQLGEIRVTTVSRQPERVVESPAAVAVVEPGRVADLAATGQVPLLIADLPGVQVVESGVHSFTVNPRSFNGLVNRRLLVMVDGRDVGAAFIGSPEWSALAVPEEGTRVELVRGPGSALYGANAFNGVLSIVTPSVRQQAGTRLTVGGGGNAAVSVDGRHALVTDDLRWGLRVSGRYSRTETDDRARTRPGWLEREYGEAVDGAVPGSAPLPGFELVPLAGQTKETSLGVPGPALGEADPLTIAGGEARIERYLENGGAVTVEGGFTRIENQVNASGASRAQIQRSDVPWARAFWGTDRHSLLGYWSGRTGRQLDLSSGRIFEDDSDRLHLEGQLNRSLGDRTRVVVGGSLRRETIDSRGTVLAPEHDGRADEYYGLYGQAEVALADGLELVVVGRWDASSLFDSELSPRAALVWSPADGHNLRLTYGRAYLMPSPTQRFVRFPLGPPQDLGFLEALLRQSPLGDALDDVPEGTLLTNSSAVPVLAIGDQNLGPEEVTTLELGYKAQLDRVYLAVDAHWSRFADFFTDLLPGVHPDFRPWVAPGTVPDVFRPTVEDALLTNVPGLTRLEDGSTAIVFAVTGAGEAEQWGVDMSLGLQLTDEVELRGNYSYVTVDFREGTFLGTDSLPTNTPPHTANLSASWTRPQGLRVRLGVRLVDRFAFKSGVWEGRVPGRQSVDLAARYPIRPDLEVGLSATNLLDQKRYHYFGGSIVGRRLTASLTWEP